MTIPGGSPHLYSFVDMDPNASFAARNTRNLGNQTKWGTFADDTFEVLSQGYTYVAKSKTNPRDLITSDGNDSSVQYISTCAKQTTEALFQFMKQIISVHTNQMERNYKFVPASFWYFH